MAIETLTREGDFIIPNAHGAELLRANFTRDSMMVTTRGNAPVIFSLAEAVELRDWITRRLEEPM